MLETSVTSKTPTGFKKVDKFNMKLLENKLSADYNSTENQMTIKESEVENDIQIDENILKNYFNGKNSKEKKHQIHFRNNQKLEKEGSSKNTLTYDTEITRKNTFTNFGSPIRLNANKSKSRKGNSKILKNIINKREEIKLINSQPIFQTKHIKESMNKLKTGSYQSPALRNFKLDYYINKQLAQEKREE
jgi:hypothetical protein